jgi:hypothetical protein
VQPVQGLTGEDRLDGGPREIVWQEAVRLPGIPPGEGLLHPPRPDGQTQAPAGGANAASTASPTVSKTAPPWASTEPRRRAWWRRTAAL